MADGELGPPLNGKHDPVREREAQAWIVMLTGADFSRGFADTLRDGTVLCDLANAVRNGIVPRVYRGPQPFRQMENVANFVDAARAMGVGASDLFATAALFEQKDVPQVTNCVLALKCVAGSAWHTPRPVRDHRFGVAPYSAGAAATSASPDASAAAPPALNQKPASRWRAGAHADAVVPRMAGGGAGFVRPQPQPIMSETNRGEFAHMVSARRANGSGASGGFRGARRASIKAARAVLRKLSFSVKQPQQQQQQQQRAEADESLDEDSALLEPEAPHDARQPHRQGAAMPVTPGPDVEGLPADWRHVPISSKPPPLVRRASIAVWLQGGASRAKASVRQLRGMFEAKPRSGGPAAPAPRAKPARHPRPQGPAYLALARFR